MKILDRMPDGSVVQHDIWSTDIQVSVDGTEQRIALRDLPKRSLELTYQFTDIADARRMFAAMLKASAGMLVPFFHQATKLTPIAARSTTLQFDASRTELREGEQAFIFDRRTEAYEIVTIESVTATGAKLLGSTAGAWGHSAYVAPVWAMYADDNAVLTRNRVDGIANGSYTLTAIDFIDPYLNEFAIVDMTIFASLPVLNINSVGDTFDTGFNTGATVTDYGGVISIRDLWKHSQLTFSRDFLCQRVFNRASWNWWRTFADYCKGSLFPFYMPTFRSDFALVGSIVGAEATLKGTDYADDYFAASPFKQLAIRTAGGWHYASVTTAEAVGGNTRITLDPPLPSTPGYETNQRVSLLLKCRISDDTFSVTHTALSSTINLAMRTVDE